MTRMVFARILTVVALLLGSLPIPAIAACKLSLLASVDVRTNPNGAVLVPLQVNGHDVWMLLNMSSGMPFVSPQALDLLGLKPRGVGASDITLNGRPVHQQARADSLRIGNANFTDWDLYVQPGPGRPPAVIQGRPVVGSMASSFMNVVDLELDLADHKINLFKHSYCDGAQIYWGAEFTKEKLYSDRSGLLYFAMEVDGKRVETSLNTEGQRSLLSEKVTRDYFGFERSSPGVSHETLYNANGLPIDAAVRNMSLTAHGLSISNLPIIIESNRGGPRCTPSANRESGAIGFDGCYSVVPMELGTAVLSKLRVFIAPKEKRIYFTRVEEPAPGAGAVPSAHGSDVPGAAAAADPQAGAASAAGAAGANPGGETPPAQ